MVVAMLSAEPPGLLIAGEMFLPQVPFLQVCRKIKIFIGPNLYNKSVKIHGISCLTVVS